jgi:hypothetical protein
MHMQMEENHALGPTRRRVFLPEVREFITRHTAYNKHDTGWAKGAPSEDHTTVVAFEYRVQTSLSMCELSSAPLQCSALHDGPRIIVPKGLGS